MFLTLNYKMAWVGMDLKDHEYGLPSLDQVAQSSIQPGFEHFQGWGIHGISGQPVPHHPHSTESFPNI